MFLLNYTCMDFECMAAIHKRLFINVIIDMFTRTAFCVKIFLLYIIMFIKMTKRKLNGIYRLPKRNFLITETAALSDSLICKTHEVTFFPHVHNAD